MIHIVSLTVSLAPLRPSAPARRGRVDARHVTAPRPVAPLRGAPETAAATAAAGWRQVQLGGLWLLTMVTMASG